jgi:ankyrin repeat protein
VVELLRRYGAIISSGDICTASETGDADSVRGLLKRSPDLAYVQDKVGRMPIHLAAIRGHKNVVEVLLANKVDVNIKDKSGRTPLHWAAHDGHTDLARFLLANGAEVLPKNFEGDTPLRWALEHDHQDVAELLYQASGRDRSPISRGKADPKGGFLVAVATGDSQLTRALLTANPRRVAIQDDYGRTPLHWAAITGHTALSELLLAANADVNARTDVGATPLHLAAHNGRKDMIELLLANGAEINSRDDKGATPFSAANYELYPVKPRHLDVAELLRQHGGHE